MRRRVRVSFASEWAEQLCDDDVDVRSFGTGPGMVTWPAPSRVQLIVEGQSLAAIAPSVVRISQAARSDVVGLSVNHCTEVGGEPLRRIVSALSNLEALALTRSPVLGWEWLSFASRIRRLILPVEEPGAAALARHLCVAVAVERLVLVRRAETPWEESLAAAVADLPSLRSLSLWGGSLTSRFIESVARSASLRELTIPLRPSPLAALRAARVERGGIVTVRLRGRESSDASLSSSAPSEISWARVIVGTQA